MPLPKSITSLLTAIVVAIPAAITTLALNKPKPPKEIDAIIQLDENKEVIDEQEINPTPKPVPPPKPPESSQSNQGTPATGSVPLPGGGDEQDSEGSSSTDSSDAAEVELEEEDDVDNHEEEVTTEEKEQKDEDEEIEDAENDQVPEPSDSQKDVTIEELQKSIKELMQRIIDEGNNFNTQSGSLYSLYTIKTGLETLPELINSLKAKIEENKKNGTSEGISGGSESSSSNGDSKGAKPGEEGSQ